VGSIVGGLITSESKGRIEIIGPKMEDFVGKGRHSVKGVKLDRDRSFEMGGGTSGFSLRGSVPVPIIGGRLTSLKTPLGPVATL
jgi:hypothetical protein